MKKIFSIALALSFSALFSACSNGDYVANPSSNANNSVNPLNPSDFNWTGTGAMSATIDGVSWVSDSNTTYYAQDSTVYLVQGYTNFATPATSQGMIITITNVDSGGTYNLSSTGYAQQGIWLDSVTNANQYFYSNLGNSGGLKILEDDSVRVKGLFYFQGISHTGQIVNITNGYFNIKKI